MQRHRRRSNHCGTAFFQALEGSRKLKALVPLQLLFVRERAWQKSKAELGCTRREHVSSSNLKKWCQQQSHWQQQEQ